MPREVMDGFKSDDQMLLEPRLVEYLDKKKYYEENNIESQISLEQMFQISNNDIKIINKYLKGKKRLYKKQDGWGDFVDQSDASFPSSDFKKDKRFERLKNKMKKDKDAQYYRHNNEIVRNTYDMYREDRNFASMMGDDMSNLYNRERIDDMFIDTNNAKFKETSKRRTDDIKRLEKNPHRYRTRFENDEPSNYFSLNSRDFVDNDNKLIHPKLERQYNYPPKIQYNDYLQPEDLNRNHLGLKANLPHKPTIKKIIGELESYRKVGYDRDTTDFSSRMNFDSDILPTYSKKRFTSRENDYMAVPYMNGDIKDVDVENYIRYTSTTTKAKSNGYENPFDHYFQYISSDIQDPNHVVMDNNRGGVPTRLFNKEFARPKKRDIM